MTTADTQNQFQDIQLDQPSPPAQARQPHATKPTTPVLRLVRRDLQVLNAIDECGGTLTTVQIAIRFWPPDLRRRLAGWGSEASQIQRWLDTISPAFLLQTVDALIWGQQINRLRQSQRVRKADQKLVAWLHGLEASLADELVQWLDSLAAIAPDVWLAHTIAQQQPPPKAFGLRLRFPSDFVSSACKKRLQYLVQVGLLEPQEQPVKLSEGRAQTTYFLTRKGVALVAEAKGVKPKDMDFKAANAYGPLHLAHRVLINDFRLALTLQSERKGFRIPQWLDDNDLRRLLAKEEVTLTRLVHNPHTGEKQERQEHHALRVPDGYCVLDMGEAGKRHCFFEVDNNSMTVDSRNSAKGFAAKIRILSAFYRSGRYKDLFPEAGDSFWLLTITTGSEARLRHLQSVAEGVIGKQNRAVDRYWFTTIDHIPTWEDYYSTAIFSPIWRRGGSERLWALDESV